MSDTDVFWYSRKKLVNPMAIVGFPTVGLVGSIVASFVSKQLGLEPVAGISGSELPPYALVQKHEPLAPIRAYAGPAAKDKKGRGRDLVIVTSEIVPKPEQAREVTEAIMSILKDLGVSQVICLEGVPVTDDNRGKLLGVGSTESARKALGKAKIPVMEEGIVRGISGVMLYLGNVENRDISCILTPANPQIPDPGAAAGLIEPLKLMIKGFEIDIKPLRDEAENIEKRMREQQAQHDTGVENIYG